MNHTYLRGDMYYADLEHGIGTEQEVYRPIVIIQNNVGNKHSPMVIIASITSKKDAKPRNYLPTTTSTLKTAWNCALSSFWNNCEPWINAAWVILSVTYSIIIYAVSITLWRSESV